MDFIKDSKATINLSNQTKHPLSE